MSAQVNTAAQEHLAELINSGQIDRLDEVFAADVVDHDPAPDQGPGPDGFKAFFSSLRSAFPDAKVEAEALLADDEHVAIAYTLTGTHEGEFHGLAPTGRSISVRGLQIARFAEGKIVERWGSSDEFGLVIALGAQLRPA